MLFSKAFFPLLDNDHEILYFDSAASTQTHSMVLESMDKYYKTHRANCNRGSHILGDKTNEAVFNARQQVADFINASPENIMFTSGATESLNMVAKWNEHVDTVIITNAEHHANIIPWLEQNRTVSNGRLAILEVELDGSIDLDKADKLFQKHPGCLLSMTSASNILGNHLPWETLSHMAHAHGISVAIDFCQSAAHHMIDLEVNGIEWACFSGHKMYGPTGIGVLYTKFNPGDLKSIKYGGGAVLSVTYENVLYSDDFTKHEPGTPNIAGMIGMGTACELISYDREKILVAEHELETYLMQEGIFNIPGLQPVNVHRDNVMQNTIFTFVPKIHCEDISQHLAYTKICLRTGNMCAHPLANELSSRGLVRISLAPYNTKEDCDALISQLTDIMQRIL